MRKEEQDINIRHNEQENKNDETKQEAEKRRNIKKENIS